MIGRWSESEARAFPGPLGQRIYSSRLLGSDPALVLHGGGNTSVKLTRTTLDGDEEDLLLVKASGCDLASIDESGFVPLRLRSVQRLARLERLGDVEMASELRAAAIAPDGRTPSVEALLHGIVPHAFVDHTHADAVIALTNTPSGERHAARAFGDAAAIVPYVRPGFELAARCRDCVAALADGDAIGIVLLGHGLVSFGATARESYERMIRLVGLAEDYLAEHGAAEVDGAAAATGGLGDAGAIVALRSRISAIAGRPLVLRQEPAAGAAAFARDAACSRLASQGPAVPDHAIRTKRVPLVGRDVDAYAAAYCAYFAEHAENGLKMLDPAPRVVLDPELGLCTAGETAAATRAAAAIYLHTVGIIRRAEALEAWRALSPAEIFAVEYWELEQAKLAAAGQPAQFEGEVALVTGAASGIGRACVEALLAEGAAVCGLDLAAEVAAVSDEAAYLGLRCDVTDGDELRRALDASAREFGGLDMLVLSAGVFPRSATIAGLDDEEWRRVFDVNLDANLSLMRLAHGWLGQAPRGGRVTIVGSKNVAAPGPGAAAYSASKAALTQLARVAALEWGADGIRVNVVHPNAVFDTGIWDEETIEERARSYGLTARAYRTSNVLQTEIASADVARLVVAVCGRAFAKTTGAQISIDGGNERVI
jgi:rhamnose utilization protein RhaD (predicted bifunctional aldolase and dehydrogenase)/NAD(P)-dependent dehydrogenase (short-subunit alcohol dehydrogenase family)